MGLLDVGASPAEVRAAMPGDDLVPRPRLQSTRARTIRAPAAAVWPWIVQIGQGRGGFYSHQWLENLVGCDIHNADRIVPELQQLQVGDVIRLTRRSDAPSMAVARIAPERSLVLRALAGGAPEGPPRPVDATWAFVLRPVGASATRLVVRNRWTYEGAAAGAAWHVVRLVSLPMEHRMLAGVARRAERARGA